VKRVGIAGAFHKANPVCLLEHGWHPCFQEPTYGLNRRPRVEEYFADGMMDALITELAHSPNLRVVSRTSILQGRLRDRIR
jgi:hypothetical protein